MINLRELPATRVLFEACGGRRFSVTVTENLGDRHLEIQITDGGILLAKGTAATNSLDGFPVCLGTPRGTATITNEEGLRQFISGLFSEHLTDRGSPLGIALEDAKPVPVYDPGQYVFPYVFPKADPEAEAQIKAAVRDMNSRMIVPRQATGYSKIDKITLGPDDVLVLHYPQGDAAAAEDCRTMALEGFSDRPCLLLPDGYDAKAMPLAEVIQLRDRLNEIIYDKERG